MTWQLSSFVILGLVLAAGFGWYERSRPSARVLALVAALAALAVVGRLAFAAFPNVKPTTDIVLLSGYALGGAPGFAVGAITPVVSNVFMGHGPWTPWQMAAWGGVGVAGALLRRAVGGRTLGRWWLALACAAAGVAFGAVMDTYQWTLAARQDLGTWVAVSGSSLPYNLAHVLGNVAFCLLVGPAFLRALDRYRRRFEVRWAPAAAAAAGVLLLVAAPAASAGSAAGRAADWLERAQNRDGGFGSAPGQASGALFSGWASLGLAAAGRNPGAVAKGRRSAVGYLRRNVHEVRDVGEVERTILVVEAAGLSARRFGGRDLVARLERFRRPDGSYRGFVSYTAFGILAVRAADAGSTARSARWLARQQNDDGGFGLAPAAQSDVDNTGAALQALAAAGRRGGTVERAVRYLRSVQNRDGGFGQSAGRGSNSQSTAYAVQGLAAAGRNPARFKRARRSPIGYLRARQARDGSVRYSKGSAQTPVWVTAQAVLALRRKPFPLDPAPRRKRPAAARPAGAARQDRKAEPAKPPSRRQAGADAKPGAAEREPRPRSRVASASRLGPPVPAASRAAEGAAANLARGGPDYLAGALMLAAACAAAWAGRRLRRA